MLDETPTPDDLVDAADTGETADPAADRPPKKSPATKTPAKKAAAKKPVARKTPVRTPATTPAAVAEAPVAAVPEQSPVPPATRAGLAHPRTDRRQTATRPWSAGDRRTPENRPSDRGR